MRDAVGGVAHEPTEAHVRKPVEHHAPRPATADTAPLTEPAELMAAVASVVGRTGEPVRA